MVRRSCNGERYHVGRFSCEEEAAAALRAEDAADRAEKQRLDRAEEVADRVRWICERFPDDIGEAFHLQRKLSEHVERLCEPLLASTGATGSVEPRAATRDSAHCAAEQDEQAEPAEPGRVGLARDQDRREWRAGDEGLSITATSARCSVAR